MTVGEKLRALRGSKTLKTAAEELQITKSALAMYEKNQRVPRDEIKYRLAAYYGQRVSDLFFEAFEHK